MLVAAALAADPLVDSLGAELERSLELSLPEAPIPYFVAYRIEDVHNTSAWARLGGLLSSSTAPQRTLGVELRVGSAEQDDSNFESYDSGSRSARLVIDDDPIALRHDAWLASDLAYKGAVETIAAKEAALRRRAEADDLPDFVPGPAQQSLRAAAESAESEVLVQHVRALSAVFVDHPDIEFSVAQGRTSQGRLVVIDTRGTEVVQPISRTTVVVVARARADDGTSVVDHATWVVRRPEDLPLLAAMRTEVEGLALRLERWRDLPALEEEYVGPVLFQGEAAIDVVRHLLLPPLQGTPAKEKPPRGSRVIAWDDKAGGGPMRVKRRLLPSGYRLVDDPQGDPSWPSTYAFDLEGEPATRVELVSDGVIRRHLMTRTPSEGQQGSTGHARGRIGDLARAMPSNAVLTAARTVSPRKLHKQALKVAAEYDLDHYVVVRRLAEPALDGMSGGPMITARSYFGFDDVGGLPAPVVVAKVYADGREELVRGTALVGVDTRAMRDVVGAGPSQQRTRVMAAPGDSPTLLMGQAVTLSAPDLLLGEAELAPSRADAEPPPEVPSPLATPRSP